MNSNKYTVDRIDDGIVVLLKRPDEEDQLLIPLEQMNLKVSEGDIMLVSSNVEGNGYEVTLLENETIRARDKVKNLINKLKNK